MRNTTRQRGSVGVFVIVGTILVLIALGVLFGVKRLAMNDQTPPLAVSDSGQSSSGDTSSNNKNEGDAGNMPADEAKSDDATPEEDNSGAQGSTASDPKSSTEASSGSSATSDSGKKTPATNEALPQSGPSENMAAIALAAFTMSSVAYIRSLRRI